MGLSLRPFDEARARAVGWLTAWDLQGAHRTATTGNEVANIGNPPIYHNVLASTGTSYITGNLPVAVDPGGADHAL